jgi:endonuclease YncB( thermonuclease family)
MRVDVILGGRYRPRRSPPRSRAGGVPVAAGYALCLALALVALAIGRLEPSAPSTPEPPRGEAVAAVRVIDGDTIDVAGERVRLVNIDAPEMPPKSQCAYEADKALRATAELKALVADGVVLQRTGTDRYGRTLAYVRVDGADAGQALIAADLVRPWEGRRRSWCA